MMSSGTKVATSRGVRSCNFSFFGLVTGPKNTRWHSPCRPEPAGVASNVLLQECSSQNRELADEAVQQRQSHRREEHDHRDGGVDRHHVRDATVFGDLAGMPPFVENADDQEQGAGRDSVVNLLRDRSADPQGGERENSQRTEAEVAYR